MIRAPIFIEKSYYFKPKVDRNNMRARVGEKGLTRGRI